MSKLIVAFDAGSSSLKMGVFSAERNRIQLIDFDVSPLSVPAEASLEEKNRILARQMKASLSLKKIKSNIILVSISGQSVFTRFVKLPAVEEAKVSQIIRYEAQQQVPFPIEDVEWDHNIIGKTPTGEIDIVLVAAKNDVIALLVQECGKAGLDVADPSVPTHPVKDHDPQARLGSRGQATPFDGVPKDMGGKARMAQVPAPVAGDDCG